MKKLITFFHGFCMALADSVPGVSGGTIAFLMGFYDNFVSSLNRLISGKKEERIAALKYLVKLGTGWVIGFVSAILVLSRVFESYIYFISSMFIGFILLSIPVVIMEEKSCLKNVKMLFWAFIGLAAVAAITYLNSVNGGAQIDLGSPNVLTYLYVFVCGAIAICAMILPGISGSTLLLIFGIYLPIITGIKEVLSLNFKPLPILIAFGLGVVTGIVLIIKLISSALEKHRAAMVYLIIGLMTGSLYAIAMGPATLDTPQPALSASNFSIPGFLIGAAVIAGIQVAMFVSRKRNGSARNN